MSGLKFQDIVFVLFADQTVGKMNFSGMTDEAPYSFTVKTFSQIFFLSGDNFTENEFQELFTAIPRRGSEN